MIRSGQFPGPDLIIVLAGFQGHGFRIDLDHGAIVVATDGHERIGDRPRKRVGPSVHQFRQHLRHVARVMGRNGYMMDHGWFSPGQYVRNMRAISCRSAVTVNASESRMRAFCGFRLSAIRKPAVASRVPRKVRPDPARVHCTTMTSLVAASRSASNSPGGAKPGAKPAEMMPRAPAATKARVA